MKSIPDYFQYAWQILSQIIVNGKEAIFMPTTSGIAPHETFELHEILTFKNVCATKSATMVGLVKDEELKSMLQKDFTMSQGHIQELLGLIRQSEFYTSDTAGTAGGTGSRTELQ
jgi:similar to spore coat protein